MKIFYSFFPKKEQTFSVSVYSFAYSFGVLLGHATGGFLYSTFGFWGPFGASLLGLLPILPGIYIIIPKEVDEM